MENLDNKEFAQTVFKREMERGRKAFPDDTEYISYLRGMISFIGCQIEKYGEEYIETLKDSKLF